MILKNGYVFTDGSFTKKDISISGKRISAVGSFNETGEAIDCTGKYIIPGLTDIHTHGCIGYDFSTASVEEIGKMRRYYLQNGITSIMATTVTMSDDDIVQAVKNIQLSMKNDSSGARILGINLEGPYLSPRKCGAHDISLLKKPDIDFVNSLGNDIKIVNIAPEYDTSIDFIKKFKGKCSIAHTDCGYEKAKTAIELGADHITHIFNAMNGLHHREPGVIGAFFDTDAYAEIICDTVHIAPPVLRMMFAAKPQRLAIISDSMAAAGLSDGEYTLGKLSVTVKNSIATLSDGVLAGSVMNVYNMMKKLISIGVKKESAVSSSSEIPAKSLGLNREIGRIAPGCTADMVITDGEFNIEKIIFEGKQTEAANR
ncbi:MAG: N-acetylglucosamine-6-phosphate deacetylase [Clostridiales bacterium]|nr:N-acetylglucosamine-6-phosphate deacetylase [Clostridiales bacterium]